MNSVEERKLAARERANLWYLKNKERAKVRAAEYYQKNKDEIKERVRGYRLDHSEEIKAKKAEWYEDNKESVCERMRLYYLEHADEIRARVSRYYEEHKEEISEKQRQYYQEHREEFLDRSHIYNIIHAEEKRAYQIEYAKLHPEVNRVYRRKRKALLKGFRMTEEMFRAVIQKHGNKCYYCGIEYPDTSDHYIPLMKDGEPGLENIVPACMSCNCKKGDMLPDEFRAYMEREKILLAALNGMER